MSAPAFSIRPEIPADEAGVRTVEERAFGRPVEARLVDALRAACPDRLSLVAVTPAGEVVGHVLFTPVTIGPGGPAAAGAHGTAPPPGMGLGPLAVLPELQRQGIGSALMERSLLDLRAAGCPFVAVVGHPEYYPRFGFVLASGLGLRSQWDAVPDEAWMALVLDPAAAPAAGVVRFRPEFDAAAQDAPTVQTRSMPKQGGPMFATAGPDGYQDVVPGVRRKTLCHGRETLITEFRLTGGYELPGHGHPHEQTGYLVSGRLRFTIGDETREVGPGDSWCIPSGVTHGAVVLEDSVAVEVFSPLREDFLPAGER